jgi:hypothetical protein
MKTFKTFGLLLIASIFTFGLTSCVKDIKQATTPVLSGVSVPTTANMGDSIVFSATITDQTALSTLKARLYYGEDLMDECVIRTKANGTYTGKVYAPYFKDIPNGDITITLIAQNIEFGLVTEEHTVALTRPDWNYLNIVSEDGMIYKMERKSQYYYEYTGNLPQTVSCFIYSPDITAAEMAAGKNKIQWGATLGTITEWGTSAIKFTNSTAGTYTISFNTKTYEAAPFADPVTFAGQSLTAVSDTQAKCELNLTQGQTIKVAGMSLDDVWIDPDYFSKNNSSSMKFLGATGKYRVTLDSELKYFCVERMNGSDLSTYDDGNSFWLIGWGAGKPNPTDNNINWDTSRGLCMNKVSDNVFSVTTQLVAGFSFKFFYQKGWGGELKGANYASFQSNLVVMTDAGNFEPIADYTYDFTKSYTITLDLTGGINAVKMTMAEYGTEPEDPNVVRFAGEEMTTTDGGVSYTADVSLKQGQVIKTTAIDFSKLQIDPDFFSYDGENMTFLPVGGDYRITLYTGMFFKVERLAGSDLDKWDTDQHAIWLIGGHVGKPDAINYNIDWTESSGLCMAEIKDKVFQITFKIDLTGNDASFKFFYQRGWGGEFGKADSYSSYQSDLVKLTDSGNFDCKLDPNPIKADQFYRVTLDATEFASTGRLKMSMAEYTPTIVKPTPKFNGESMTKDSDGNYYIDTDLSQGKAIPTTNIDLTSLWIDPDWFSYDGTSLKFLAIDGSYRIILQDGKLFRVWHMNGDTPSHFDTDSQAIWMIGGHVGTPDAIDYNTQWWESRALCMAQWTRGIFRLTFKIDLTDNDASFKFFWQNGWGGEFGKEDCYSSYQSDLVKINGGNFDCKLDPNPIQADTFYTVTLDATSYTTTQKLKMTMVKAQ